MDIEKLREEADRLQDELRRMNPTDENYKAVASELERISEIILASERYDLDRINSNVKNDISEENIRIDMEKVKTDRLREWLGLVKSLIATAAGIGMGAIAYKGEVIDFKLPIRQIWDGAKNLIPKR